MLLDEEHALTQRVFLLNPSPLLADEMLLTLAQLQEVLLVWQQLIWNNCFLLAG